MSLILLALTQGLIFAALGAAVRLQYSLFRGFDVVIAPIAVVSGETFLLTTRLFPHATLFALAVCTAVSIATGVVLAVAWNTVIDKLWPDRLVLGSGIFIVSLGFSTFVTGAVGLGRGPGLRLPSWDMPSLAFGNANFGIPSAYGFILGLAACSGLIIWSRTRLGFAFDLWAQNQVFATEIGISRRMLLIGTGVSTGTLVGVAGSYGALANGSTPESGLTLFLYGAGAALLLPKPLLLSSLQGGLALGILLVLAQLEISPSLATVLVFGAVTSALLFRGTSRVSQGLR